MGDLNRVYKYFGVGYLRVLFSKANLSNLDSTALRAIGAVKLVQADGFLIKPDFGGFKHFSYERKIGPRICYQIRGYLQFIYPSWTSRFPLLRPRNEDGGVASK